MNLNKLFVNSFKIWFRKRDMSNFEPEKSSLTLSSKCICSYT